MAPEATPHPGALNQLLAVRKGMQNEVHSSVTILHRDSQRLPLLTGMSRSYRKINDEDPDLPGETQRVQLDLTAVLAAIRHQYTRLWDLTATIDAANCYARGSVVVGDRTLLADVPVTTLLFLEKQLENLRTIIEKLPVLDPAETWHRDTNVDAWATERATTVRTKKVPRNHVLAEATAQHPAQVQVWHEDVTVGYWDTTKFSGAIPGEHRQRLLNQLSEVRDAVKVAREEANSVRVQPGRVADALFAHILTL